MRIAIVGKGGSGKTTLSSLFSLYLDALEYRVGLLDVDVNSHTAELLGVSTQTIKTLSTGKALDTISQFLAGSNPYVKSDELLNTTPPGDGSGRWTLDDDNLISKTYGAPFAKHAHVFTLGSYSGDSIGADCHHSTQNVAENLLSHAQLTSDDAIVIDSVAGNDTFANSLYLQDILLFVLKPEREGLSVFKRYMELAARANVDERVYVVGNHVNSRAEASFIKANVPENKLLGMIPSDQSIIERRLEGKPLDVLDLSEGLKEVFSVVKQNAIAQERSPQEFYDEIVALHRIVASKEWVAGSYRNGLIDQIDPGYHPA